jgi:hypothetical protein
LRRTSFSSSQTYYDSVNFFYWLNSRYYLDSYYFSRFYRNTEPLITPQLARLTMSQPLSLSNRLLSSIDELEALMRDQRSEIRSKAKSPPRHGNPGAGEAHPAGPVDSLL